MNNNITESYCSFEVSKLLKEKGFDVYTIDTYNDSGHSTNRYSITTNDDMSEAELQTEFEVRNSEMTNDYISKPTHALAIEWIRVNFDLWIQVEFGKGEDEVWFDWYVYSLDKNERYNILADSESELNTPQEATEAALLYVLTKLIYQSRFV